MREFKDGAETSPYITLDLGSSLASIRLTYAYRSLIRGLNELGDALAKRRLTLRVYHLPAAVGTTEHKERVLDRYIAGDYTLAILEPDTILNITDLNQAEYCARQYLLSRLTPSTQSMASMRGNLVHSSFKELLKEHDRGELMAGSARNGDESALTTLHRHFEQALERSSLDLALLNTPPEEIRSEVAAHLESLANWFNKQHATLWDMPGTTENDEEESIRGENAVRAETFLLAPEIGLRGRLDLLWRQKSRQRLLELKTGSVKGELPKSEHRWQVQGYHALLAVRRDPKLQKAKANILYSGIPGEAEGYEIRFSARQFQRVIETRNTLVLSHVTGIPPAPPGVSRCSKCARQDRCQQVSFLLDWQPPHIDAPAITTENYHLEQITPEDKTFFATYYRLLHVEGLEGEKQQALLWQQPVSERVERGVAIDNLQAIGKPEPDGKGEWRQTFRCVNTSELREGDEVLLSDGDPITGEVVTGTIVSISSQEVTVWTPELIAHPKLLDRYDINIVHVRTLQNLLRWLQADPYVRRLVAGIERPRFRDSDVPPSPYLNGEQNLAVQRALQMQDYLLIHGPPGTGKTSVIAEIVKRLVQQGQRVLLAAFTNQAVDNMLKRLDREGFSSYVRLGHERSVDESIQKRLLKSFVEQADPLQAVREALRTAPVIASTTATWSSDKYAPPPLHADGEQHPDDLLQFDVAIIDEAGQLTIPAILGALRFVKRFILVGDEKQLPPLVLSKEAALAGLSRSLFSSLKQYDEDYRKEHPDATSACVALEVQYRMNKWISRFSSRQFYDGRLKPHSSVANRLLEFKEDSPAGRYESPAITQAVHPKRPMVFLDVREELPTGGTKISNAEARVVREVVAALLERGIEEKDIGIIAPYRAQVANLRRHLFSDEDCIGWKKLPDTTALTVDTVDRFQGGERPVIILSFATSSTPEAESQLREHLTDNHRLNVALTRAQRKLLLVGNAAALETLPVFQQLLAYCQNELRSVIAYAEDLSEATFQ